MSQHPGPAPINEPPSEDASPLPRLLDDDASPTEQIRAINGLANEVQLCRLAIQNTATHLGELAVLVRKSVLAGAGRSTGIVLGGGLGARLRRTWQAARAAWSA